MMYPYMILADETEIVHSQIIEKDGMKKVIVNFERPIEMFEKLLHSNAHLLYKYAENGGIQIA